MHSRLWAKKAATDAGKDCRLPDDACDLAHIPATTLIGRVDGDPTDRVSDPWQRARYDEWTDRLGAARMHGHLRALDDQFRGLLLVIISKASDEALHRRAHDVASTAGMLGFDKVTRGCRALLEPSGFPDSLAREKLGCALREAIVRLGLHFMDGTRETAA